MSIVQLTEQFEKFSLKIEERDTISNVHQDDIHGLIHADKGGFISGSKDGCITSWSSSGCLNKKILEKNKIKYEEWITALAPFNNKNFISGTRDGQLDLWSFSGKHIKSLDASTKYEGESKTSKERNVRRITCITTDDSTVYVGRPCHFSIHTYNKKGEYQSGGYCETSENDWVYCIQKIASKKLLVVTGDKLDLWTKNTSWNKTSYISPKKVYKQVRPFISSLTPLLHAKSCFGLSLFDGSVKCIDIESSKITFDAQEHEKRVWMVENLAENVFASCGDDKTIKIWDIRVSEKSQKTLKGSVGRVSALLSLKENVLVSGSCPDNLYETKNRAEFTFWDVRKV